MLGKSKSFHTNTSKKYVLAKKHNFVETAENNNEPNNDEVYDVSNLFKLNPESSHVNNVNTIKVDPLRVNVTVDNQSICFEIDTGAVVSVISEEFYNDHFKSLELKPSDLSLRSYIDVPIEPVGKIKVKATYQNVNKNLELYVIKNGTHLLMGRHWLSALDVKISFQESVAFLFVTNSVNNNPEKSFFERQVTQLVNEFSRSFH